jgi:hypothetical protein
MVRRHHRPDGRQGRENPSRIFAARELILSALFRERKSNALYLTAGRQFRIPRRGHVQPFGRVLLGAGRINLSFDPQLEAALKRMSPSARSTQTSFALHTGGGLDYELTPHFNLRSTAEYLGTWFFHDQQNNLLISGGAIFRW